MNLLKELILLFLISILFIGCSKKIEISTETKKTPFSAYYFAIKNPTYQDYTTLNKYMNLYDPPVKYEAAVELAGYYVKTKEYAKAANILQRYLSKIDDNSFLRIIGTMWLFASYEHLNNSKASDIYKDIKLYENIDEYNNAVKAFCISLSEPIYINNESCLDRMGEKYNKNVEDGLGVKKVEKNNLKMKDEEKGSINETLNIFINKINIDTNLMSGALLALYKLGLDFKVATEGSKAGYKYVVEGKGEDVYLKNGINLKFSWDFNKALKVFYEHNKNNFKSVVVIVSKDSFIEKAVYLKMMIEKSNLYKVRTITYTEYGFQDDLRGIYNKYGNDVSIISVGLEKDIVDILPLIRFIFTYKVPFYAVVECFSGLFLEKYYVDYFNYSNIYAFTDFISDENYSFYTKYKEFYGTKPKAEALIGYDIILYLSNLKTEKKYMPQYLSGIVSINAESEEVIRTLRYYYIKNNAIQYYDELKLF